MGPADDWLRVAVRLTLQGDAVPLGHVLFGGYQSLNGGGELHVEGVAQLYRRLEIEVAEEGPCVPRPRVGDGESRTLDVDARVRRHLFPAHRQKLLAPSSRRLLLDDEFVPPGCWRGEEGLLGVMAKLGRSVVKL